MFQSQTGSQALSDSLLGGDINRDQQVSIPNGKPGPLRPRAGGGAAYACAGFNPKREARPSQTVYADAYCCLQWHGFNPKREARPSQTDQAAR